jgi:hypothetical protein
MDLCEGMAPGIILVEGATGVVVDHSIALGVPDIHIKEVRHSEVEIREICPRIAAIDPMAEVVLPLDQEKELCRPILVGKRMKTGEHLRISKLLAWRYLT